MNCNSPIGKKWLEQVISNNKCGRISATNKESDSENSSDLEDFENLCEKDSIDLNADCTVIAINPSQKYYMSLNLYLNNYDDSYFFLNGKNENLAEERLSVNLEKTIMSDLSNWFDKFMDGMLSDKKYVKEWPVMNT